MLLHTKPGGIKQSPGRMGCVELWSGWDFQNSVTALSKGVKRYRLLGQSQVAILGPETAAVMAMAMLGSHTLLHASASVGTLALRSNINSLWGESLPPSVTAQ